MKQFFSENLSGMTFNFTFITLLNLLLHYFEVINLGDEAAFILGLALLILALTFINYIISFFNFKSLRIYRWVNLLSQLIIFFFIASLMGLVYLSVASILINSLVYISLYFLHGRYQRAQLNQLANKINQRLANNT
jgi:hypothetical protein